MKKTALQMFSIRDLMEQDVFSTIKATALAGYTGIEFAGFFGVRASEMKKFLEDNGLTTAGSHTSINDLSDEKYGKTVEYNLTLGNKNIIVPYLPKEMRESSDAWKNTAELFNRIGCKLAEDGIKLFYHNHDFEFIKYGGMTGFDILFGNTQPCYLGIELDTYWVHYAGFDSLDIMKKYGERVNLLHLRDMLPGEDKRGTEVGNGIIDFESIISLGLKNNVEWCIVEQEQFDIPKLESIAASATYINKRI